MPNQIFVYCNSLYCGNSDLFCDQCKSPCLCNYKRLTDYTQLENGDKVFVFADCECIIGVLPYKHELDLALRFEYKAKNIDVYTMNLELPDGFN